MAFSAPPADAVKTKQKKAVLSDATLQRSLILLASKKNPVAQKLLYWLYATETETETDPADMIKFIDANPTWPRLDVIKAKVEESLSGDDGLRTLAWFNRNPPQTEDGLYTAMAAVDTVCGSQAGDVVLNDFWRKGLGDKKFSLKVLKKFSNRLTPTAQLERFEMLFADDRFAEAELLLPSMSLRDRQKNRVRIALARMEPQAPRLLQALTQDLQNDQSLILERVRWRRLRDRDAEAIELLKEVKRPFAQPRAWWPEINILARDALNDKDYKTAYELVRMVELPAGTADWAQALWMQGWIALKNGPSENAVAVAAFGALYNQAHSAITRSRSAYWSAETARQRQDAAAEYEWLKRCAVYDWTFYGQVCASRFELAAVMQTLPQKPELPEEVTQADGEILAAIRMLHASGMKEYTDSFFARLLTDAKNYADYHAIAKLAIESERVDWAIEANKRVQQNLSRNLPDIGYPKLPARWLQPAPESALVHAIVYRESMFRKDVQSPVGATGLMQLMPRTAKQVARQLNVKYKSSFLSTDPAFNIRLGSKYLNDLILDYDGFYPLAIAAYNAGPGNVSAWIKNFGDPRDLKTTQEIIDWIEHIPIYETRNYVQRVLETLHVYAGDKKQLHLFPQKTF
jgi:soluble lytic murein transglycosylase